MSNGLSFSGGRKALNWIVCPSPTRPCSSRRQPQVIRDRSFGAEYSRIIENKIIVGAGKAEIGTNRLVHNILPQHVAVTNGTTERLFAVMDGHWVPVNILIHHAEPVSGRHEVAQAAC